MPFEHIEQLKREYTDKYVVVDAARPELARFRNAVGQIKTVNMNGQALVEFDQYLNTGWYDIHPSFLKVVPKPEPKPAEEKPAKKPAEKPAGEKPAAKPAAAKPATSGKPSTADILAAARAKKAGGETAATAAPAKPVAAPAAKTKPSTADILAAARGKAAAPAAKKPAPAPVAEEVAEEAAEEVVEEPVAAPAAKVPAKSAGGAVGRDASTAEKIAYCRKVDAR